MPDCAETKMQMRRLDCVREGMLCKVWEMVVAKCGHAGRVPLPRRSRGDRPTRRFKGRPFSYFGFLKEAARPTNMAPRKGSHSAKRGTSWRAMILPYSEL